MSRFLAGFFLATLVWGGLFYAQLAGIITVHLPGLSASEPDAGVGEAEELAEEDGRKQRKRPKKRRKPGERKRRYRGVATTGDDLGGPGVRELNAAENGGEEQLRNSEVEAGFDQAFPKIRRCLMLAASEDPITGRIVFGMRIEGSGRVTKVNLKGPAAITRTEAGDCMRKAARGIQYRSFNGPDMVVHYPFTLE